MSKWIDVKDKMPDKDGRYIICEDYTPKWVGVCSLRKGKWDYHKVTHWMPLPEIPKDE